MRRYLLMLLLLIPFCTGCTKADRGVSLALDRAGRCMEQFPDSALMILDSLRLDDISGASSRARYALLKSIALDKNYIDVTDDSLTSIALSYYKKRGTADERLKAYLYSGRVHKNAKDYEQAMNDYLCAEEYVKFCNDNIIIGMLYSSKAILYNMIFDMQSAIGQQRLATRYFLKGGDTARFINGLNNEVIIMHNSNSLDSISLVDYYNKMEEYWHKLKPKHKDTYYFTQLELIPKTDTVAVISMIDKYLTSGLGDEEISWLSVADAYLKVGDIDESLKSVKKYKLNGGNTDVTYYHHLSEIFSKRGEYKLAYEHYKHRSKLLSDRYKKAVKTDTKFLEERYEQKMQVTRQKYLVLLLSMGIVIILLALFLLKKHYGAESKLYRKELERLAAEKENYELKYREAINEQEELKGIIETNKSENILAPDMLQLVSRRLAILDKFIAANISSAFSNEAMVELDQLMKDKALFLESTRSAYSLSHPGFIEYLKDKGLTDREVACCCLYCTGLNGSEISSYLEIKSFYNVSAVIRKKLSVDRSMNIDTYLRRLLKTL